MGGQRMNVKKTVAIAATTGLLTALALPALADTEIYGSLRDSTAWTHTVVANGGGTNTKFDIGNDPTSRLGVKYSAGNLSAQVELGIGDPGVLDGTSGPYYASLGPTGWINSGGGLTAVYTRHAFGTYKFDVGTLLVGQTWDPYTVPSEQHLNADNSNVFFGALYDGRMPQLKFTLNNGLYADVIRSEGVESNGASTTSATYQQKFVVPKLAIGYDGKVGSSTFGVGVLGQTYKDTFGKTQNSGMLFAHSKIVSGPIDVLLNFSVGENIASLGFLFDGGNFSPEIGNTTTHTPAAIHNVTTVTGLVGVGYKATDTVKFNAGIGGGTSSAKAINTNANGPSWDFATYLNTTITLAKNVYVIPEYDFIDTQKSQAGMPSDGARNHVFGASWRIDF